MENRQPDRRSLSGFELFESLYSSLRRFAAVVADSDVDPDDLVQEALVGVLARRTIDELDNPAAYLKRSMVNAASGHRRRAGRWRRLVPLLADDGIGVDHYPSDLAILDQLDPLDRAVVFLLDVEGYSGLEAADELGLTHGAVRKRASRARRRLRSVVGAELILITSPTEERTEEST